MQFIQKNNLEVLIDIQHDPEQVPLDSAMYYNDKNLCEMQADKNCVTSFGIYFGTSDSHDPMFCPRHYFQGNGYIIKHK